MEQHYDLFNQGIRKVFNLFKEMPSKFKGKLHINRLQERLNTGIRGEPSYAITVIGPMMWQARDEIKNKDETFFTTKEVGADLMELSKTHKFDFNDADNAVKHMRDAYKESSKEKKEEVFIVIQEMFNVYISYLKACKAEAKSSSST